MQQEQLEMQQVPDQQRQLIIVQQQYQQQQQQQEQSDAEEEARLRQEEARRLEEERRRAELKKQAERKSEVKKEMVRKEVIKVVKTDAGKRKVSTERGSSSSSQSLSELHALRLRLEAAEDVLSQYIHVCFGDNAVQDCSLKISQLEVRA